MTVRVRERPLGSGVYWVFVNHHKKRKAHKIGTDKELAFEVAQKIDAKIILDDFDIESLKVTAPLFKDYYNKWLSFILQNRRWSTYERYQGALVNHVLPYFKNMRIDEINRGKIKDFLVKKSAKMDIKVLRDVLSGVLSWAVDDEHIFSNPVIGITKKINYRKPRNEDIDCLNKSELETYLNAAKKVTPVFHPLFYLMTRTGCRLGEAIALRWQDVQFTNPVIIQGRREERPFILIRRSYRRKETYSPKNNKPRRVDMTEGLMLILKEHMRLEKERSLKRGKNELPELVFNNSGEQVGQSYVRDLHKTILQKAGLRGVRVHDLRHSWASILLSEGVNIYYVSKQLGHSDINLTCNLYGKLLPESTYCGANCLDSVQQNATSANKNSASY